jgi:hypothetical protein
MIGVVRKVIDDIKYRAAKQVRSRMTDEIWSLVYINTLRKVVSSVENNDSEQMYSLVWDGVWRDLRDSL